MEIFYFARKKLRYKSEVQKNFSCFLLQSKYTVSR